MINKTNTALNDERFAEYCDYIAANRLTKHERTLLREWLQAGHSVYETVESRYLPGPVYPPMDFIDAYRLDRSLGKAMSGMTRDERISYLKEYMGYEDPSYEELEMERSKKRTPKLMEEYVKRLEREIFSLWNFIWQEGLGDEAREFVEERKDEEIPFEW